MNTKEYIESGILESYVLGITTAGESAEVERMASEHPEVEIELEAVRGTLENYALQYEKQPPAALKSKIMAAVFEEQPQQNTKNNIVQLNNTKPQKSTFSMVASWALLALSIGANIFFFNNWKNSEEKIVALESQNQIFAQENKAIKASYQEEIAVLQNPDFKVIKLLGQPDVSPNSTALVYFDKNKQEVYISALDLPAAPKGKQYQFWAIVDGKPVDAGMIAGTDNILKMKSFAKPVAFAISLEDTGGSTTEAGPKGKIYVMGAV
ncbi:MAG: anti-sigma factor [Arcicella sp.]|nr:anti-sigma factor [Arcicella sp.]